MSTDKKKKAKWLMALATVLCLSGLKSLKATIYIFVTSSALTGLFMLSAELWFSQEVLEKSITVTQGVSFIGKIHVLAIGSTIIAWGILGAISGNIYFITLPRILEIRFNHATQFMKHGFVRWHHRTQHYVGWNIKLGKELKGIFWQQRPVDKRIRPLVDTLNREGILHTIASCQGHFMWRSSPYVYFACSANIATELSNCLELTWRNNDLKFYWEITGTFDQESVLRFNLRSPELSLLNDLISRFWMYVVRRNLIDKDIQQIAKEFSSKISEISKFRGSETDIEQDTSNSNTENLSKPPLSCIASNGIRISTMGAGGGIGSNLSTANNAIADPSHKHSPLDIKSEAITAEKEHIGKKEIK